MSTLNPVEIAEAMRKLTWIARKHGVIRNHEVIDTAEFTYTIAIVIRDRRTDDYISVISIPVNNVIEIIRKINYEEFEECVKKYRNIKQCLISQIKY